MQAIIPGKNVRLFAKMISCLQKIGEDLFIEGTANKLILRALNANRSAYFCFNLLPNFFRVYDLTNNADCRYKVLLKACTSVFKGINNVEECIMKFTNDDPKLVFEMNCKMGVKKTYKLNVEDCEPLQAVYSHENCPHKIVSRPKLLIDCIQNFAANIDEITLVLTRQWVRVKSFIDDQKADDLAQKSLLTELNIDPQDFERFDLNTEAVELTFCLKEMKAILGFCEVATQPISLFMDEPGKPILLNVKLHNAFEADFVLATLLEPANDVSASGESQQQYSQMSSSQQRGKGTQGSSSVHPTGAQRSTLGAPSQSSPMNSSAGSPGLRTPPPLTPAKRRASEIGSDDEPHSKRMKSPDGSAEPLVWGRQLVGGDVEMSDEYNDHSDVPPSP